MCSSSNRTDNQKTASVSPVRVFGNRIGQDVKLLTSGHRIVFLKIMVDMLLKDVGQRDWERLGEK